MSDSIDNGGFGGGTADFGGSVEAAGGMGGIGGGNSIGATGGNSDGTGSGGGSSTGGSGDLGLGGPGPMSTTAADWGALSTLAATAFLPATV